MVAPDLIKREYRLLITVTTHSNLHMDDIRIKITGKED